MSYTVVTTFYKDLFGKSRRKSLVIDALFNIFT